MALLRRNLPVHSLTSLQARLLLIVLLAIIPAVGLALYNGNAQRAIATQAAQEQTKRWADQTKMNQRELIGAAHQLLLALQDLPAIRSQGPVACQDLLAAVKTYPFYANLGVINRAGEVTCSAAPVTAPIHLEEHPYLQALLRAQSAKSDDFELGSFGGKPTVNIALPLTNEQGATEGLIFAALDTAWFAVFAETEKLPANAMMLIISQDDTLATRVNGADAWTRLIQADPRAKILTRAENLSADVRDTDNVVRLYTLVPHQTSTSNIFIGVGIPTFAAYAHADNLLQNTLIVLSLVGLLTSIAAWGLGEIAIVRPVQKLIRVTEDLRAGNWSARVAYAGRAGEINKLGHAFNDLAEELQTREYERARAAAAGREQRTLAESLRDIAEALNSTLDYDQVLDRILDNVGRVVQHDTVNIMLFEQGAARVVRSRGFEHFGGEAWIMAQRFDLTQFTNMHRATLADSPVDLISDTGQHPTWVDLPESRWIRSHLGVPIRTKGRVLGILNLDSAIPNFYGAEHVPGLQIFANQAAIALENARLLRESHARANQFAALYATASDLAAPQHNVNYLLQNIIERAIGLLRASMGTAYLYDLVRGDFELVSQKGIALTIGKRVKLGQGLVGQVGESRQAIVVDNYQTWDARMKLEDPVPLGAIVGVPMLYGGELVGVITIAETTASTRQFTNSDARLLTLFAGLAASMVRNARLFQETRTRAEQLAMLYDAGLALNSVLQPQAQLEFLFTITMQALRADRAEFLRYDSTTDSLRVEMAIGFSQVTQRDLHKLDLPLTDTQGITSWVGRNRLPLYLPDVTNESRWIQVDPDVRSGLWVPVETDKHLLGVLAVLSTHTNAFTPDDERLLILFSNQVAVAMENARLFQDSEKSRREMEQAYNATLEGWSRALDLRDEETEGHTQRVTQVSVRLARMMQLSDEQIENIRRGALLHDIGKMGIPDRILFKPGPLTDDEWHIMQRHPFYANELISQIEYLRPTLDIPYCHHERWDGKGYPRGLQGEQIPLAARIFAIVDVWDALLSQRPYREPWTMDQVLTHVESLAGTHLDPQIVQVFLRMMRAEREPIAN